MTKKDIEAGLKEIRRLARDDPEAAHGREEALYEGFVAHVASAPSAPRSLREKAKLILTTQEIKYPRW